MYSLCCVHLGSDFLQITYVVLDSHNYTPLHTGNQSVEMHCGKTKTSPPAHLAS